MTQRPHFKYNLFLPLIGTVITVTSLPFKLRDVVEAYCVFDDVTVPGLLDVGNQFSYRSQNDIPLLREDNDSTSDGVVVAHLNRRLVPETLRCITPRFDVAGEKSFAVLMNGRKFDRFDFPEKGSFYVHEPAQSVVVDPLNGGWRTYKHFQVLTFLFRICWSEAHSIIQK